MLFRLFTFALVSLLLCLSARAENAPSCNAQGGLSVADFSQDVTRIVMQSGASGPDALKRLGIKTVVRYYDKPDGFSLCKTLQPDESDAIINAGLSIVSVYQHHTEDPEHFLTRNHGTSAAKRAIELARANGQPAGSAIYFAVDGVDAAMKDLVFEYSLARGGAISKARKRLLLRTSRSNLIHIDHYSRFRQYYRRYFNKPVTQITPRDMLPSIEKYFRDVNGVFKGRADRYKIGVYGSGMVCEHLREKGLIDYCWLAQSKNWPQYKSVYNAGRWVLAQKPTTRCSKTYYRGAERVAFNFNRINPKVKDFGQWSKKSGETLTADLRCKLD